LEISSLILEAYNNIGHDMTHTTIVTFTNDQVRTAATVLAARIYDIDASLPTQLEKSIDMDFTGTDKAYKDELQEIYNILCSHVK